MLHIYFLKLQNKGVLEKVSCTLSCSSLLSEALRHEVFEVVREIIRDAWTVPFCDILDYFPEA